jgi:hypothetical protein
LHKMQHEQVHRRNTGKSNELQSYHHMRWVMFDLHQQMQILHSPKQHLSWVLWSVQRTFRWDVIFRKVFSSAQHASIHVNTWQLICECLVIWHKICHSSCDLALPAMAHQVLLMVFAFISGRMINQGLKQLHTWSRVFSFIQSMVNLNHFQERMHVFPRWAMSLFLVLY